MPSPSHPAGIATFHRLERDSWPPLEARLPALTSRRPVTLLLPCHARESAGPALERILQELSGAAWIRRIILGLDGATEEEAVRTATLLRALPQETRLLRTASPQALAVEEAASRAGLTTARERTGKGRNLWLCTGAALALEDADAESAPGPPDSAGIVLTHDCDIRDYTREIPGRLSLPLLSGTATPEGGAYRFNKGFYSRHRNHIHGRVQRLLVRPLLRAMELRAGPVPGLQFMSAFRYQLAGESAFDSRLLRTLDFPAGWGLEAGLLDEVRRRAWPAEICQTELCAAYDHNHQDLSPDNPDRGLHRMAREVSRTLLATVSGGTYPWREEIVATWEGLAPEAVRQTAMEAALNGLEFDAAAEHLAVRTFSSALEAAIATPAPPELLPSWQNMERALPGLREQLRCLAAPVA